MRAIDAKCEASSDGAADVDVGDLGPGAKLGKSGVDRRVVHIFRTEQAAAGRVGVERARAMAKFGWKDRGGSVGFARFGVNVNGTWQGEGFDASEGVVREEDLFFARLNQAKAMAAGCGFDGHVAVGSVAVTWIFRGAANVIGDIGWDRYNSE
jgi:hypothetical protein